MNRQRRVKRMEETKEELGLKKTGEKTSERKSDEALRISDYMDTARGLTGLVKDNYIAGSNYLNPSGRQTWR